MRYQFLKWEFLSQIICFDVITRLFDLIFLRLFLRKNCVFLRMIIQLLLNVHICINILVIAL